MLTCRVLKLTLPHKQNHYYGLQHPMKPQRLRLTHHLLLSYGLYQKMEVFRPHKASPEELQNFHAKEYIDFLSKVSPATEQDMQRQCDKFMVGGVSDCPSFDGLFDFMSMCAGGSMDAAVRINRGVADVCVNWAGGLHHAKKAEAEGFCYINDIVLCILELLKYHARVLYVDIDIHHGDGVEEAFYTTNRVMTCSFHKYGDFFPGSGAVEDIGSGAGKYCSVNVPLMKGLDDASFEMVFKPVIDRIFQNYAPEAVVMCCGADSIAGDRIGCWNLTLKGHASAVSYLKSFGVPLVLLGGGGYTPRNVARCWAYETATAMGVEDSLKDEIPENEMYQSYGPDYRLHLDVDRTLTNRNTRNHVDSLLQQVLDNLNRLGGPPSVPFQDVPADFFQLEEEDDGVIENTDESRDKKQRLTFPPETACSDGMLD